MNQELTELVLDSGAPPEMLEQLWFVVFVQQFADRLLTMAEEACTIEEQ